MAKHGHRSGGKKTPTYQSWACAKARCNNPNNQDYADYGGRGISFTDDWDKFENFLKDMGERPFGHTLDRIDVNGPYSRDNCRWSTYSVQNSNQRRWQPLEGWE